MRWWVGVRGVAAVGGGVRGAKVQAVEGVGVVKVLGGGVVRVVGGWVWAGGRWVVERGRGDRGSGTIWVVAFMAVIWVGGVVAVGVGGVRAARHRGDAAADLAALAAAARVADGAADACGRAEEIARRSGARMVRCRVRGENVDVSVTVALRVPLGGGAVRVLSRARAGPVGRDGVTWPRATRCTECQ
ncbi:Rv3654c family TadE-like protein [Actinomadura sp. NPDC048394]|uniref:Rv3654c family TadE-like protein n=1 Tax=Actinomadura sp. NPDC048394 TaxID=3158223 RepID=UPI0033E539BB